MHANDELLRPATAEEEDETDPLAISDNISTEEGIPFSQDVIESSVGIFPDLDQETEEGGRKKSKLSLKKKVILIMHYMFGY